MARTYRRDARGRFASGGYSGQSGGRGARLTATGLRKGGGAKVTAARHGGTVAKPRELKPGAIKPKTATPAASSAKSSRLKWETPAGFGGRRRTANISNRLKVNVAQSGPGSFRASVVNTKTGEPRMSRSGFRNVSEAKAWGQKPSARGFRLMGGKYKSEAASSATGIHRKAGTKPSGTVSKTRKGGGAKIKTTAPKGTVGKARSTKSAVKSSAKVSRSQRAIATRMKKAVASKNVQATRILQKMAARDGYSGDVKELTAQRILSGNRWTRGKKGNTLSATKSKDLMLNRAPSPALVSAAVSAASAGRVSRRRLDAVLKASGADYMSINRGYDRAVSQARQSLRSRRNRR